MKSQIAAVKLLVLFKTMEADFSEKELGVLKGSLDVLQNAENAVEVALKKYEATLKMYKNSRW